MRAGRVVLLLLAVLVVLAVAGAWLVPGTLDWNKYRPEIERLATAALGRPVHIGGAIKLDLLPEPVLTAGDLRIEAAGDGIALAAHELRLRTALGPLLAGHLHARSMMLQGPTLRLPWPPPPGALQSRPAWLRSAHAEIQDGTLQVGGISLTGINAQFATDPDTGTLSGAGSATLGGRVWRFTARLAQPGGDGVAGLEATLDGEGPLQDTGGRFSGTLAADGALAGSVTGRGRDLSLLVPAPAVAWQASGTLTAAGGLIVADDLALELGGSPARGVVALRVGEGARLDLSVAASRLDLDRWLPVLARAPSTALPTGIDLSAEAATLAGGTLRQLRGGFDLADGTTNVRDLSALLPGDATLALSGQTLPGPGFHGTGRLMAPDLHATLRWAAALMPTLNDELPSAALRAANLTGTVAIAPAQLSLSDLRGTLDGARVEGGTVGVASGPRPLLSANLTLDGLVLDTWLPPPDVVATGYPWPDLARRFAHVDADLTLQARSVAWAGVSLSTLGVEAHFDQHGAQIRRLAAKGMDMQLDLSGALADGGRIADGRLDLVAKDAGKLRGFLPPDWGMEHLLRGPAELHVRASGPPAALAAQAEGSLGDLRAEAQPILNVPARSWAGPVSLRHPGAPRLLAQLGLPEAGIWLGDGSLSLVAQAAATPDQATLRDAVLTAGALRLDGTVAVHLGDDSIRVTGQINAESLPLPRPPLRSSDPLPLGMARGWDAAIALQAKQVLFGLVPALADLRANVTLQDGTLRLDAVNASLAGGVIEGTAALQTAADPPHLAVEGRVSGAQLSAPLFGTLLDVRSGLASAQVNLSAKGYSPAALLSTLSGEAGATLRDGAVTGFDLTGAGAALTAADTTRRDSLARAAVQGGTTAFSTLDLAAQLRDGTATLTTARLTGPGGTTTASGSVDLHGDLLDLRLALHPGEPPDAPELAVSLYGPAATPSRTPNLSDFVRWSLAQPTQ